MTRFGAGSGHGDAYRLPPLGQGSRLRRVVYWLIQTTIGQRYREQKAVHRQLRENWNRMDELAAEIRDELAARRKARRQAAQPTQ